MKLKLSHKFALIMLGTVVLSASLSAFLISRTTRAVFMELVRENDIQTATILAENIAGYYRQYGDWGEVEELLEELYPLRPRGEMPGMMRGMRPAERMVVPGMRQGIERIGAPFLLADAEGRVVLENLQSDTPERLSRQVLEKGVPVIVSSKVAGYIFVQSMIDPVLSPFHTSFLNRIYRSIVLSMLIVGILAPLLGIMLMRHITVPLQRITTAAVKVARGRYNFPGDVESLSLQRSDEIGDLTRSFRYMTREIRAADEWKRALIADSAHELRTPVSLLQGNIEMMLEGVYPLDTEHLQMLRDETNVLKRLVVEMQDLANAEAGIVNYHFEKVEMTGLLDSLVKEHMNHAGKKGLSFDVVLPNEQLAVYSDRQKIIQVLNNVLQNAIAYTPDGGTVLLRVEKGSDGVIEIVVEDSGSGIPEEEREKVFQRFYRVEQDRNRNTGGSGLGLAIAKEIVLRHDGSIRAAAPEHLQGSRIELRLPLMKVDKNR